jgi:hypothetical protein
MRGDHRQRHPERPATWPSYPAGPKPSSNRRPALTATGVARDTQPATKKPPDVVTHVGGPKSLERACCSSKDTP